MRVFTSFDEYWESNQETYIQPDEDPVLDLIPGEGSFSLFHDKHHYGNIHLEEGWWVARMDEQEVMRSSDLQGAIDALTFEILRYLERNYI